MKLLSLKELEMFDYVKTRKNIEEYLENINIMKYKYQNVLPPSIASKLFDIRVDASKLEQSAIESYIIKKDEFERKYKSKLLLIELTLSNLSRLEELFFKDHFIHGFPLYTFEKQFNCGPDKVEHIKKSSVIKFALALDLAVYK